MGIISWLKQNTRCPFAKHTDTDSLHTIDSPVVPTELPAAPQLSIGFLATVKQVEEAHPLLPQPVMPDANAAKYRDHPLEYIADKQAYETALLAFTTAAKARGTAVAGVIGLWLASKPLVMLQELLDQPPASLPIFSPAVGPVIVMRHEHVITCLERTDLFTVDRYAAEMARATDDKVKCPLAFSHFMLGTDNDTLYRLDGVLLRHVINPDDKDLLTTLARTAANDWLRTTYTSASNTVDIVSTIARDVPLRLVSEYLGVHAYQPGEASVLPGLCGGDEFPLSDSLQQVFSFQKISQGRVPTWDLLHDWIQDAFRNIFNNGNPASPDFQLFRERGIIATEYLSHYIHCLLEHYKAQLTAGEPIPDTMLTRLLHLQNRVVHHHAEALEQEFTELLGQPLAEGELEKRLSDSMIRSNVFGTAVGAVANPQEAMTWVVDTLLKLKEGLYHACPKSDFKHAVALAQIPDDHPDSSTASEQLRKYALEALRLQPQSEVVLRVCVQDNTALGNVLIRKGTVVFVAQAAAMRDQTVIVHPLHFDTQRDEQLTPYLSHAERKKEDPQSQSYLQHGYGRHKCLGRYASEITLQESLKAVLRLGDIDRASDVVMDAQHNYPVSFNVRFTRKN